MTARAAAVAAEVNSSRFGHARSERKLILNFPSGVERTVRFTRSGLP
jgi:hypothetical protein